MARHANVNWNMPEGTPHDRGGSTHSWNSIHTSLLMDIREELQRLNKLLHCSNFIGIPSTLTAIKANTTKRKYTKRV
jgi:hypothetical protein